jgi:XTP/dITP diphosphohydrolase
MKKFIVATGNKGKLGEIRRILKSLSLEVISMKDVGINIYIEEYGNTFEENALIKALEVSKHTPHMVMADDSGLEVDFLNGAPGVYSSRFLGKGATDEDRNRKLLDVLKNVPFEKRTARFVCAAAVVLPDSSQFTVKGTCEGYIGFKPEGENGFGYDPLFFIAEYNMTMAQMKPEDKNKISHRGRALKLMVEEIKKRVRFDGCK